MSITALPAQAPQRLVTLLVPPPGTIVLQRLIAEYWASFDVEPVALLVSATRACLHDLDRPGNSRPALR